jgi:hypothetical protein
MSGSSTILDQVLRRAVQRHESFDKVDLLEAVTQHRSAFKEKLVLEARSAKSILVLSWKQRDIVDEARVSCICSRDLLLGTAKMWRKTIVEAQIPAKMRKCIENSWLLFPSWLLPLQSSFLDEIRANSNAKKQPTRRGRSNLKPCRQRKPH